MRFCIQYRFVCELFAFENVCVIPVYDISTVNLIVGWCFFACSMNCLTWCLFTFQIENLSSIYFFQTSGLRALRLRSLFLPLP